MANLIPPIAYKGGGGSGGGYPSISSPDSSLVVGGTAAAPTVEANTLNSNGVQSWLWGSSAGILPNDSTDFGATLNTWLNGRVTGQLSPIPGGQLCTSVTIAIPTYANLWGTGLNEGSYISNLPGDTYTSGIVAMAGQYSSLFFVSIVMANYAQPLTSWNNGLALDDTNTSPNYDPHNLVFRVYIKGASGEGVYGLTNGHGANLLLDVWSFYSGGCNFFFGNYDCNLIACHAQDGYISGYWFNASDNNCSDLHSYNNGEAVAFQSGLNWAVGARTIYSGCLYIALNALTSYTGNPLTDTTNWAAPQRPMFGAGRGTQNQAPDYGVGYRIDVGPNVFAACSSEQNTGHAVDLQTSQVKWSGQVLGWNYDQQTDLFNTTNPNYYSAFNINGSVCQVDAVVNCPIQGGVKTGYLVRGVSGTGSDIRITTDGNQLAVFSPDTTPAWIAANRVYVNGVLQGDGTAPAGANLFLPGLNGSGFGYINPIIRGHQASAMTLNLLLLHLFHSGPAGITISEFDWYVTTVATAGGIYHIGVYEPINQQQPFDFTLGSAWANLLLDAGSGPTTSLYGQTLVLGTSLVVPANTWFAIGAAPQVAAPSIETASVQYGAASPFGMNGAGQSYNQASNQSLAMAGVSGAMPASFVPSATSAIDSGVGLYRAA